MCLCSELEQQNLSGNGEVVGRVEAFLTLLYEFLSKNEQLISRLPFALQKKAPSLPSAGSEKRIPQEGEKRIAKIYEFDPLEYSTRTLLNRNVDKWDEHPDLFLTCQRERPAYMGLDPQHAIIFDCLQLEQSDAHSHILRRFYCIALHRQREHLGQKDSARTIAQALFTSVYPDHVPKEGDNLQDLTKTIETLIRAGARYRNIAEKLGLGSLFLLGDKIPNSVWEKWLPLNGSRFDLAMKHLSDKQTVTLGKAYEKLAQNILRIYLDRLPKNSPTTWINENAKTKRMRESSQSRKPKPKRQRGSAKKGGHNQIKATVALLRDSHRQEVPQQDIQHVTGHAFDGRWGSAEVESGAPGNCSSRGVLLDVAEHIERSTPSQQLPSAASLLAADQIGTTDQAGMASLEMMYPFTDGRVLHGSGCDSGELEFWTDGGEPMVSGQPDFWRGDNSQPYFWSDGREPMVSGQPDFWRGDNGQPYFWSDGREPMVSGQPDFWVVR